MTILFHSCQSFKKHDLLAHSLTIKCREIRYNNNEKVFSVFDVLCDNGIVAILLY